MQMPYIPSVLPVSALLAHKRSSLAITLTEGVICNNGNQR